MSHDRRPELDPRHPVHVTLRVVRGLPNLRAKRQYAVVRGALEAGAQRFGFTLVHFSVQGNHLHLLCEAEDKRALARGLKGLQVRIARRVNARLGRRGRFFADRYHAHVLSTPKEVRHALAYVLNNARKHMRQRGKAAPTRWVDPCSTAKRFFSDRADGVGINRGLRRARTWLLNVGWSLKGTVRVDTVPT